MAIEFHCEHCNREVKAPADAAGHRGKCPHCGGAVYIPLPKEEDDGTLPLKPLDPTEERQRRKAIQEAIQVQQQMLHEGARAKGRQRGGGVRSDAGVAGTARASPKELSQQVVSYVEAMAGGQLGEAEALTAQLLKHRPEALSILDEMATGDLAGYHLPALPRPVLLGFLKQLRMKLQG